MTRSIYRHFMNQPVLHVRTGPKPKRTKHKAMVVKASNISEALTQAPYAPKCKGVLTLLDHPHPVEVGNLFWLPDGALLRVVHIELIKPEGEGLQLVFLS